MFNNIGGKIKAVAMVFTWIGIAASFLIGVVTMEVNNVIGVLIILIGSVMSWLGSFLLYGYGEAIESLTEIKNSLAGGEKPLPAQNHVPRSTAGNTSPAPKAGAAPANKAKQTAFARKIKECKSCEEMANVIIEAYEKEPPAFAEEDEVISAVSLASEIEKSQGFSEKAVAETRQLILDHLK